MTTVSSQNAEHKDLNRAAEAEASERLLISPNQATQQVMWNAARNRCKTAALGYIFIFSPLHLQISGNKESVKKSQPIVYKSTRGNKMGY